MKVEVADIKDRPSQYISEFLRDVKEEVEAYMPQRPQFLTRLNFERALAICERVQGDPAISRLAHKVRGQNR